MRQIYKWRQSSMKYAGYLGITKQDERKLCWYDDLLGDPLPDLSNWETPRLVQYLGEGKKKRKPGIVGDSPSSASLNLISQNAADALTDIWDRHALLYPVILDDVPNMPYYMVVVQTELPFEALDREKSTGKPVKYGPYANQGFFAPIETWVFDQTIVSDNDLFSIPDTQVNYFVSERFKQRVIEAGLQGFCLRREFWEEKPFIS